MALHEQNRMLQILHRNVVSRKNIRIIINDLKGSGIFDEDDFDEDVDWDTVDQKAAIWFSDLSQNEKLEAIEQIDKMYEEQKERESTKSINRFLREAEERVLAKIKEMEEKGLTGLDVEVKEKPVKHITTRYGRSPLHEAIAMKDIHLVKKYIKKGLYLTSVDNNGHTPVAMAYYEGYKEAIVVFDAHKNKK